MRNHRFNLATWAGWMVVLGAAGVALADEALHEAQRRVREAEEDVRWAERDERRARRELQEARTYDRYRRDYWVYTIPPTYHSRMYQTEAHAQRVASLSAERERLLGDLERHDPYLEQIERAAEAARQRLEVARARQAEAVEAARTRAHERPEYVAARADLAAREAEIRAAVEDAVRRLEETDTFRRLMARRAEMVALLEREAIPERERRRLETEVTELERSINAVRERFLAEDWRTYAARSAHNRAFNETQRLEQALLQEEIARDPDFDALDREVAVARRQAEAIDADLQYALRQREAIVRSLRALDEELDRSYQAIIEHDALVRSIELQRLRDAQRARDEAIREQLARDRVRRARERSDRAEERLEEARRQEEREARRTHLSPDPPRVHGQTPPQAEGRSERPARSSDEPRRELRRRGSSQDEGEMGPLPPDRVRSERRD